MSYLVNVVGRQCVVDGRPSGTAARRPERLRTEPAIKPWTRHHSPLRPQISVQLMKMVACSHEHRSRHGVHRQVIELDLITAAIPDVTRIPNIVQVAQR